MRQLIRKIGWTAVFFCADREVCTIGKYKIDVLVLC